MNTRDLSGGIQENQFGWTGFGIQKGLENLKILKAFYRSEESQCDFAPIRHFFK